MLVINLLMNISNSTFPTGFNSSRESSHKELNRDYNYFIEDYDYGYIIALIGNGYFLYRFFFNFEFSFFSLTPKLGVPGWTPSPSHFFEIPKKTLILALYLH